ncbi:hypothetical protein TanjilG_21277 [Lupinus angustifolius]|uniref:Uncharacterized protein n=1 Tax=Lupinus angustifolius TaxID=3871 RepID=A0A4P1RMD6_LUPAN|nr:hypothetical protein TanjilG_21277 [Lupinus angustifolius]
MEKNKDASCGNKVKPQVTNLESWKLAMNTNMQFSAGIDDGSHDSSLPMSNEKKRFREDVTKKGIMGPLITPRVETKDTQKTMQTRDGPRGKMMTREPEGDVASKMGDGSVSPTQLTTIGGYRYTQHSDAIGVGTNSVFFGKQGHPLDPGEGAWSITKPNTSI